MKADSNFCTKLCLHFNFPKCFYSTTYDIFTTQICSLFVSSHTTYCKSFNVAYLIYFITIFENFEQIEQKQLSKFKFLLFLFIFCPPLCAFISHFSLCLLLTSPLTLPVSAALLPNLKCILAWTSSTNMKTSFTQNTNICIDLFVIDLDRKSVV